MASYLLILILNLAYLGRSFAGTDSIAQAAVFPSKEEMWSEIERQRILINQETDLRLNYEQNFMTHLNTLANLEKRINDELSSADNDEQNQRARLSVIESELANAAVKLEEMTNKTNTLTSAKHDRVKDEENQEARLSALQSELVTAVRRLEEMENRTNTLTADVQKISAQRKRLPGNCQEIRRNGNRLDGVYTIYPDNQTGVDAYCDMQTDGGGWTVLLARSNSSFQGNRSWTEYKAGFGKADGNYWIGNENIHLLTRNQPCQIYFKLQSTKGTWFYANYDSFSLGSEADGYTFHFNPSSYAGNAGESLDRSAGRLNGRKFSTYDRDNDRNGYNCAVSLGGGGWWYDNCGYADLTAMPESRGLFRWSYNIGKLKAAYMMIRPM